MNTSMGIRMIQKTAQIPPNMAMNDPVASVTCGMIILNKVSTGVPARPTYSPSINVSIALIHARIRA